MRDVIRVPRTTVEFTVGLYRILREHMGLNSVQLTEHWTFQLAATHEECGHKGYCSVHGFDDEYLDELEAMRESGDYMRAADMEFHARCTPFRVSHYLGTGQMRANGGRLVELRTQIECVRWDLVGDIVRVNIWVKEEDRPIRKASVYLPEKLDSGGIAETGEECPALPPNRIAFWKSSKDVFPEPQRVVDRPVRWYFHRTVRVEERHHSEDSVDWVASFTYPHGYNAVSSVSPFDAVKQLLRKAPGVLQQDRERRAERRARNQRDALSNATSGNASN